ncbi:MAG: polyprenyl synthetase [Dehalococcoidia bacterium]|nr:polyprenyl synthetase [Dehalococcoidia bacterium]
MSTRTFSGEVKAQQTLSLEASTRGLMPIIEDALRRVVSSHPVPAAYYGMMRYHLGWADERLRPVDVRTGKRTRPVVCLLACRAVGGEIEAALPAAVALELLHNFTLIHDDIEDEDEYRHHRPTLWYLWGAPQAINAGDGMHVLAYSSLLDLMRSRADAHAVLEALQLVAETSLRITEGQHLDLEFEERTNIAPADYLDMIARKSAAIIRCATGIGARLGGGTAQEVVSLERYGEALGMAFQIRDDILGLSGTPERTGKPVGADLARRKKTYPAVYALTHARGVERTILMRFFEAAEPTATQLEDAVRIIERMDAVGQAQQLVDQLSNQAREALAPLPISASREALLELTDQLAVRER